MGNETIDRPRLTSAAWLALGFAMIFPTIAAALYFLPHHGEVNLTQRVTYSISKVIQFAFPILYILCIERSWPRPRRPRLDGMLTGIGFGLLVSGVMFLLYFGFLADSSAMAASPAVVRDKLKEFGVDSLSTYLGFAAFVVVLHSLLEEYYWRWFLFARLCHGMKAIPAALIASVAFMGHHVIVLHVYLPGQFPMVMLFSLGIAVGGLVWCWLFRRTGAIYAPWLSHLVVDAAIFVIGWDLARRAGGLG